MAATKKWKEAELKRINRLSTYALIGETLEAAGGDDYDGEFTAKGWFTFEQLKLRLSRLLMKHGVINKPIE